MLMIILGVALAAVIFYYACVKPLNYWTERGVKQGKPWWFFGDFGPSFFRLQSFSEWAQSAYNETPGTRYFGTYQFVKPILLLKDPDLIKQIAVRDFDHFSDHRTFVPENIDPLWNRNLLTLKGQSWHEMRSILSPSFTSNKMKYMFVLIVECADNFVKNFLKKDEEIITVEMKDIFTRFTNDVIATTAFGVKVDSLAEPNNEFYLMGKDATDFSSFFKVLKIFGNIMVPKLFYVLNVNFFSNEVSRFFRQLVNDTIKIRKEKGIVRPDMIHLLMEARKGVHKQEENATIDTGFATAQESDLGKANINRDLTNEDITAQALIFFFAGFDTVSSVMSFTAYELAVNQDIQHRLKKEVDATWKECGGKLTYESLLKMKYMDMVISEAMRKWPTLSQTDRVCTKPYTIQPTTPEEEPVHLEKGAAVFIPIYPIHRCPKFYPDPDRFDPERFSDENKGNINPYTYMPFGVGPRNCIGSRFALLEVKIIFFFILKHFEIVPIEKTQIPFEICKKSIFLTAANGFWLGLKRIKN